MLIDLLCPVEVRETVVKTNSETNEPYLLLSLFNKGNKVIDSLELNVKVYDANGSELATLPVEFTELNANPDTYFAETKAISLEDVPEAQNFVVEILSATFDDGEQYEYSEDNLVDCDTSEASLSDALKLRESFEDAICFAKEYDKYWRCACGTPNHIDAEACSNCKNTKEYMLSSFSSLEALEDMLNKKKEQEEAEKAAKKQKTKKKILTTILVIVIIAVIAVIGYFAKNLIFSLRASSAAKSGDLSKAYELYSKANSSKAVEFQAHAMGNTSSNLFSGQGLTAEDDEYIYFIAYENGVATRNLIKENKATGEKTILTDAAFSFLNVTKDYIYFLNNEYIPCRITKDGTSTENVLDKKVFNIAVIGNEMFYLNIEYDNAENLTEEQLQALAMQGQIETHIRLFKCDLDTKKETRVSEEDLSVYSIHNGRIYYIAIENPDDMTAIPKLNSMDLNGGDIKTHVETPVAGYALDGDSIYYISPYIDGTQITAETMNDPNVMDYSIKKLDTKTGETTIVTDANDFAFNLNISNGILYYTSFVKDEYIAAASGQLEADAPSPSVSLVSYNLTDGKKTSLATAPMISSFSISGNDIICELSGSGLARLKTDGSGFDNVYSDGTNTPSADAATPELSPDLQALADDLAAQENSEETTTEEVPAEGEAETEAEAEAPAEETAE